MPKAKQLTATVRRAFLKRLSETGNVTQAAARLEVTRSRFYDLRARDPEFRAQWDAALGDAEEAVAERLEAEAVRRAVDGVEKPYFFQGRECGRTVEYSDPLLKFLLQHRLPGRYGDGTNRDGQGRDGGGVVFEMHLASERDRDEEGGDE